MEKMFFEEPEMEVVRFDARDIFTITSRNADYEQEEEDLNEEDPIDDPE